MGRDDWATGKGGNRNGDHGPGAAVPFCVRCFVLRFVLESVPASCCALRFASVPSCDGVIEMPCIDTWHLFDIFTSGSNQDSKH